VAAAWMRRSRVRADLVAGGDAADLVTGGDPGPGDSLPALVATPGCYR
jgi:hypothetical protein